MELGVSSHPPPHVNFLFTPLLVLLRVTILEAGKKEVRSERERRPGNEATADQYIIASTPGPFNFYSRKTINTYKVGLGQCGEQVKL